MSGRALGGRFLPQKGGGFVRAESIFVALLATGCMTEPAYIGEGPATDTGGSGGSSGTGTPGVGTSGTSGTASGGTSGGGGSVPVQGGNGSATGAGSRVPSESGSCLFYKRETDETGVITWDAETRTLSMEQIDYRFDADARLVVLWYEDERFRERIEYDAMGTTSSVLYTSDGVDLTASSWEQTNDYDSDGLIGSTINYHDGSMERVSYAYMDGPPVILQRLLVSPVATTRIRYDFSYEHGRPTFWQSTEDGLITNRRTATYDAAGRLLESDWDDGRLGAGGPDGSVENRHKWFYDDEGRIIRHEVDYQGPEPWPAPLDGVADQTYDFDPECAAIAVSPHHVYGVPLWLFPYASTGGWGI